jgi:hypothetical protein
MTRKDYAKLYLGGQWVKQRKLHMIWRAIARRHLSRIAEITAEADSLFARLTRSHAHPMILVDNDGETDP